MRGRVIAYFDIVGPLQQCKVCQLIDTFQIIDTLPFQQRAQLPLSLTVLPRIAGFFYTLSYIFWTASEFKTR